MAKPKHPPLPEFTAEADADILRYGDLIDTKCLAAFIRDTHGLTVTEFDVVMRAADLERVAA